MRLIDAEELERYTRQKYEALHNDGFIDDDKYWRIIDRNHILFGMLGNAPTVTFETMFSQKEIGMLRMAFSLLDSICEESEQTESKLGFHSGEVCELAHKLGVEY